MTIAYFAILARGDVRPVNSEFRAYGHDRCVMIVDGPTLGTHFARTTEYRGKLLRTL